MMQTTSTQITENRTSWLDRPLTEIINPNWEHILFVGILLLAIFTRFYDLDTRVMSHDETSHVYYAWRLFRGEGYEHTPLTHGPLQFHIVALSYFLFGDSDFTARIPAVLTSVLTVAFMWCYRRYLGRLGALVAAFLFTISPFMLYYGRYVRNEAYVGLFGVVTLWAMLRYLESGEKRYMFYLTGATILHFTAKETAFIYTAQALLFLGFLLIHQVSQRNWDNNDFKRYFLILLIVAFVGLGLAGIASALGNGAVGLDAAETVTPVDPNQGIQSEGGTSGFSLPLVFLGFTGISLLVALYFVLRGYTLQRLRQERTFDLMILLLTLVIPMLAPFIIRLVGWDPLDYSSTGMLRTAITLVPLALIAIGIGLWWNTQLWMINAAIFYGVFIVLYTTVFTNGQGFFTGLVGSLGYWLEQQGVERGSQPWYYYILIQIPIYEYLPAIGSLVALVYGVRKWFSGRLVAIELNDAPEVLTEIEENEDKPQGYSALAIMLFGFWAVTSIMAYTVAGEKMPWLAYHIALPLILVASWGIGQLIESTDWNTFRQKNGFVVIALLVVFITSFFATLMYLLGPNPPFQGKELPQLRATSNFTFAIITAAASFWWLSGMLKKWETAQFGRVITLTFFGLLAMLTVRTAFMASYINYDTAKEYLVYAHSARGVKEALNQISEISRRTTDGLAMTIAFDDKTTYPYWWYLRNFSNQKYFGDSPTRDLRDAPAILVGSPNYSKIESVTGQAYYKFEYIRIWWPDQGYFNLTWDRIVNALTDPQMRTAIFKIWFNRDYSLYAQLTEKDLSLPNWSPSEQMRLYLRKDIVAQLWNYGVPAAPEEIIADPYEGKEIELVADLVLGSPGSEPGQMQAPRGIAVAPDGTLYIADSQNHRIQHLALDGSLLHAWGSFANILEGAAPPGTFNEPWDVAVGPDGSVYVADTWNHRIQRFSSEGEFINMWGYFGQAETPDAFWGPRSVAVDSDGRVYVSDTGNKRIVIFDAEGNALDQFGGAGFAAGQFDEPVGLAVDSQRNLFVADTWNQRVQSFHPDSNEPESYLPTSSWDIVGWYGNSLENKPYLAVDDQGNLFITDPEGYRILQFTTDGEFVQFWGDYSTGLDGFGLASGIAVDPEGGVWISDSANNRVMHFEPP